MYIYTYVYIYMFVQSTFGSNTKAICTTQMPRVVLGHYLDLLGRAPLGAKAAAIASGSRQHSSCAGLGKLGLPWNLSRDLQSALVK